MTTNADMIKRSLDDMTKHLEAMRLLRLALERQSRQMEILRARLGRRPVTLRLIPTPGNSPEQKPEG